MKLRSINPFTGKLRRSLIRCRMKRVGKPPLEQKKPSVNGQNWLFPIGETHCGTCVDFKTEKKEYAGIIAVEMGKPIRDGVSEVEKCARLCDYYHLNAEAFLRVRWSKPRRIITI